MVDGYLEDLQTLTIYQRNTGVDSLRLQWQKISAVFPQGWDISVCDNEICYTSLVDSGTMVPVASGDSGFILIHSTAHVNTGTAVVRYAVWNKMSSLTTRDTLTFIINVAPTGIEAAGAANNKIWIANRNLFLKTNEPDAVLRLYDLNGQILMQTKVDGRNAIALPQLPFTICIVELQTGKKILRTKLFIQ